MIYTSLDENTIDSLKITILQINLNELYASKLIYFSGSRRVQLSLRLHSEKLKQASKTTLYPRANSKKLMAKTFVSL